MIYKPECVKCSLGHAASSTKKMKNTLPGERRTTNHLPPPKADDFTEFPAVPEPSVRF